MPTTTDPQPQSRRQATDTVTQITRLLSLVIAVAVVVAAAIAWPSAPPLAVSLGGRAQHSVAADRATLTIRLSTSGSRQARVSADIHAATERVLALLRPLTVPPPPRNTTRSNATAESPPQDSNQAASASAAAAAAAAASSSSAVPPIVSLSTSTFASHAQPQAGLIVDSTMYSAVATIHATFQALGLPPGVTSTGGAAGVAGSAAAASFPHLALLLPQLSPLANTAVESLAWHLSAERQAEADATVRQAAMADAVAALEAYVKPLKLLAPRLRLQRFKERAAVRDSEDSMEHWRRQHDWLQRDRRSLASRAARKVDYDEISEFVDEDAGWGYEIEKEPAVAFGMEPQSLTLEAIVHGDWQVFEGGWLVAVVEATVERFGAAVGTVADGWNYLLGPKREVVMHDCF